MASKKSKKKKAKKRKKPSSRTAASKKPKKKTPTKPAKRMSARKAKPKAASKKRAVAKVRELVASAVVSYGASEVATQPGIQPPMADELRETFRKQRMANLPPGTRVWWIDPEGNIKSGGVVAPAKPPAGTVAVEPDDGGGGTQQVAAGDLFDNDADARAAKNARLGK
jgi:hypothetical protein